jgi:hypothetical protein
MEREQVVTKSQDAGDVIEFSRNTSPARGNSTAEDVKPLINKPLDFEEALDNFVPQKKSNGMTCSVKKVLDQLNESAKDKLLRLMENPEALSLDITALLKNHGYQVSAEVMRRHRRRANGGGCSCP